MGTILYDVRSLVTRACLSALVCGFVASHGSAADFRRDVRPIFSDRCYTCHGPDAATRMSPLRLDTQEGALGRASTGRPVISPGNPDESELILRLVAEDPARRMPPQALGHDPLSPAEIDTLREWVRDGAEWAQHWAFEPVHRPDPGARPASAWERNPIDRFVLARMQAAGLTPSPQAAKAKLLRRVTLDLTGIPPTAEAIRALLADRSPQAYEGAVDRLLASPTFGERMAFRWLEAARYADTNGYQNDQERDMWRWRDWVIEAFNANMPFDRFTVEQLAGDLLPNPNLEQHIATGFNRNHRGNAENGTDPEEYQVEYAVDRLETTGTVWLGLTVGCARCHDHKYDPISQREFYRFYAYFNNVSDRGRYYKYGNTPPIVRAPTREQREELGSLDRTITALERRVREHSQNVQDVARAADLAAAEEWSHSEGLVVRRTFDAAGSEPVGISGRAARFDGKRHFDLGDRANYDFYDPFTISAWVRAEGPPGGIVSRYLPTGPKGFGLFLVDGKLQLRIDTASISDRTRIESADPLPMGEWVHVAATYDGSRTTAGMRLYLDGRPAKAKSLIDESLNSTKANAPLRIGHGPGPTDRFTGLMDDTRLYSRALSASEVSVLAVRETPAEIAAMPPERRSEGQREKLRRAFLEHCAPQSAKNDWMRLRELRLEREAFLSELPTVMVMDERRDPRPTHVLFRGAFDAPRERVEPGLFSALPPMPSGAPNDRLGLARWLTSDSHPLTARVTVNRYWQMLFGRGIVSTSEDFGSQGAAPTHPELLDWLAAEFMQGGWDVKALLRLIVTSATYRQSSAVTPELLETDPDNLLLARAPRLRLPAEAIRDQALAVAGLLSSESGGPSVKPYQPGGLWKELSNWGAYRHDRGDKLYRRSLYTFWKRTLGPPAMLAFDAAARETCVVRQERTNTPIQALNLMNDPTYNEAARLFAERMLREGGQNDADRLAYGFLLATGREPAEGEAGVLGNSLSHYRDRFLTAPDDADRILAVGEAGRNASLEAPELAAYTTVASMLLNLDETITRE